MFISCNSNEDYLTDEDLSINSQVQLTRSATEQFINPDPNKFSFGEDECCLVTIVKLKQHQIGGFTDDNTATEFYENAKQYAMSLRDEDNNQRYTGGTMPLDVFLDMGKHFGLFDKRQDLSNDSKRDEYFSNKGNKPKVLRTYIIDKKTGERRAHVARITSIDRSKCTVTYTDANSKQVVKFSEIDAVWE